MFFGFVYCEVLSSCLLFHVGRRTSRECGGTSPTDGGSAGGEESGNAQGTILQTRDSQAQFCFCLVAPKASYFLEFFKKKKQT